MSEKLPFEDLERAYELVAEAIDSVGPEGESLFLAKLVVILAHETPDFATVEQAVQRALKESQKSGEQS